MTVDELIAALQALPEEKRALQAVVYNDEFDSYSPVAIVRAMLRNERARFHVEGPHAERVPSVDCVVLADDEYCY
jgi:hypothetical protein